MDRNIVVNNNLYLHIYICMYNNITLLSSALSSFVFYYHPTDILLVIIIIERHEYTICYAIYWLYMYITHTHTEYNEIYIIYIYGWVSTKGWWKNEGGWYAFDRSSFKAAIFFCVDFSFYFVLFETLFGTFMYVYIQWYNPHYTHEINFG